MCEFSFPTISNIVSPLLLWYHENKRELPWRGKMSPYSVWISEIMLQQTRIETVKSYYERFIAELPDIESLANVSESRLLKLWEGLGYYSRAKNLQKAAKMIMTEYNGIFPNTPENISKLPGIGPYTCGAISSIVFHLPEPAVDGNVLRIMLRLSGSRKCISNPKLKNEVSDLLRSIYPVHQESYFTQSLMELGQVICLPHGMPLCPQCPLHFCCKAFQQNAIAEIPVKAHPKKKKKEYLTVFHLYCQDKIAICKRGDNGLLAGLWQFPNTSKYLSCMDIERYFHENRIEAETFRIESFVKHIFTHIEWDMQIIQAVCRSCTDSFTWVQIEELHEKYALPTAFSKTIRNRVKK